MNRPVSHPLPTTGGFNKAASDASYADALAQVRAEAQAIYQQRYGRPRYVAPKRVPSTAFDERAQPLTPSDALTDPYYTGRF